MGADDSKSGAFGPFLSRDPTHMCDSQPNKASINVTIGAVFAAMSTAAGEIIMNSDKARERAEKSFKKEERAQDGRRATIEYESQARAIREKTARLKELRLARKRRRGR